MNKKNEFSIWPLPLPLPEGWRGQIFSGTKEECLQHIEAVWRGVPPSGPHTEQGCGTPGKSLEESLAQTREPEEPRLLHRSFERQSRRRPNSIALVCGNSRITYQELDQKANQLANFLLDRGIGPDTLIGILAGPSLEMAIGIIGILKAGAAYVPLDPHYPLERLTYMMKDAGLDLVLTQKHLVDRRQKEKPVFWCLDADWQDAERFPNSPPQVKIAPENLAYCIYTSGSTGLPKGVMISHSAILSSLEWFVDYTALGETDCMIMLASFSFDVSVSEFWPALMAGGRCVLAPPGTARDPAAVCQLLKDWEISVLLCVPSLLANILPQLRSFPSNALRHVFSGGEVLTGELKDAFFRSCGAELHNGYGPSETAIHAACNRCIKGLSETSIPIGRPIKLARIVILNQDLFPAAPGETGEIFIGGAGLARGYLNRWALTAERFIPDPAAKDGERLYRTGDLGYFRLDGSIVFTGRTDSQVKFRGHRIELGEIEAVCSACPGVHQAAVVICGDQSNPRLAAFFTLQPDAGAESFPERLRDFLKARVPDFMVPSQIIALQTLPLSPNGKIDRKALSEIPLPVPHRKRSKRLPEKFLERQLTELMAAVLKVQDLGPDDNFFDFGGNSLVAMRFVQELENSSGQVLSPAALYSSPTPAALAAFIESGGCDRNAAHLVALVRGGADKPLFLVHGEDGRLGDFIYLPRHMKQDRPVYGLKLGPLEAKLSDNLSIKMMAARFREEILKVTPDGNCWVGGFSFGGPVAFEICHQLRQKGANTGLVLIDSFPITHLSEIWRRIGMLYLWLRERTLFAKVMKKFMPGSAPPPDLDEGSETRRLQLLRILKTYEYLPYDGNVIFIQSIDPSSALFFLNWDGLNGWKHLLRGKIEFAQVEGEHSVFLRNPSVAKVAEQLEQTLALAEQRF